MRRLPLGPADVARVAESAPCCRASVVRWLHGVAGNPGIDKLIRAALLELDLHPARLDPMATLPPVAQLDLPVVESVLIPGREAGGSSPPGGRAIGPHSSAARVPGPESVVSIAAPPPTGPRGGVCPSKSRCRVTVLMPDGSVAQP